MCKGILILSVVFGGCVYYQAEPISPPGAAEIIETRTLDRAALKDFIEMNLQREVTPWPARQWNLALLTLAAFYYHPDLDLAQARWGVARAGVITAGARPNPSIGLSPEHVTNTAEQPWIFGFRFDIPMETLGKRGYRLAEARSRSDAARLDIASVAWQVRSRVRSRLLDLWAAEKNAVLRRRQERVEEKVVRLLEQRVAAGEASELELSRGRVALDGMSLSFRDAQRRTAEARAALAAAVGVPAAALGGVEVSFDVFAGGSLPQEPPPAEVRRQAVVCRPDVRSALAEYEAAQSALRLEIAKQYPDVHLGPGYTWEQGENHYVLGVSVTLPVLNRNRGPIAEAEACREEKAARFTAVQLEVIAEVDRALAGYHAAARTLLAADALFEQQRRSQEQVEAAFSVGEVDRLALLGAERETLAIEVSRFEALARLQKALGRLEDAIQRPLVGKLAAPLEAAATSPRKRETGGP